MPLRAEFFDNCLLRVSTRNALNDPFECLPSTKLWAQYAYNKIEVSADEIEQFSPIPNAIMTDLIYMNHGVISLTETSDNLLMWSHYGAEHCGMVLEFDAKHDFFKGERIGGDGSIDKMIHRILYRKERFSNYEKDNLFCIYELFFHKSDEWEYEKEHRLLLSLKNADVVLIAKGISIQNDVELSDFNDSFYQVKCSDVISEALYFYRVPYDAIKAVIFGCNTKVEDIQKIKKSIKNNVALNHLEIKKAVINQQDYKLDFLKI